MDEAIQPIQDMEEEDLDELELMELDAQIETLEEQRVQILQIISENIQKLLKLTDERFSLLVRLADLVLGEERAHFVYQRAAESFQSDIYMRQDECILMFLRRLNLEFYEQKWRGFDETDNQRDRELCNVFIRIGMCMTEQEQIAMHIDMEEEDQ